MQKIVPEAMFATKYLHVVIIAKIKIIANHTQAKIGMLSLKKNSGQVMLNAMWIK